MDWIEAAGIGALAAALAAAFRATSAEFAANIVWYGLHALDLHRIFGLVLAVFTVRAWRRLASAGSGWLTLDRHWGALRTGAGAWDLSSTELSWLLRAISTGVLALTTIGLLVCSTVPATEEMDRDGDGIGESRDRCPLQPEIYQGFEDDDGCPDDPDTDGDGVKDSRDSCVLQAEDFDGYLDADGCPEVDNDLDGVLDAKDKCPIAPEDLDGFEDEDGCPDDDNDGDGFPDKEDECPNVRGPVNSVPRGCPKQVIALITNCEIKIMQKVFFDFDTAKLKPVSHEVLDAVAAILLSRDTVEIEVQGHTDDQGTAAYNDRLSEQRAAAVVKYLTEHGVSGQRLSAVGFGARNPLVRNKSEDARSQNRRVQFLRTDTRCPPLETKAEAP